MISSIHPGKLALLTGGGPAPGTNGVISSVTIEAINHGIEVVGVRDGFTWLVKGDTDHCRPLTIRDVKNIHLQGGSILGTSRTNPTRSPDDLQLALDTLRKLGVTYLVTVGGGDTGYSAGQLYYRAGGTLRVVHVPKTIDNDLPLPGHTPTLGFETARHVGTSIVRNLAEDARTTSRWYIVVTMGRLTGHLALGIGKAAAATLTVIPEEFHGKQATFDEVCDVVLGSILKRRSQNASFGVAVLAEGLAQLIGEEGLRAAADGEDLSRYGNLRRDPHGHLRLGEIHFGRMVRDRLGAQLQEMGVPITLMDKDLGYELRCADPIPFDAEYTRDLGYGAVKFLRSDAADRFGAVISFVGGRMIPLPFDTMIDPETRRMQVRRVDVSGEAYECARRYMIRLDRRDLEDPQRLAKLADAARLTPDAFRRRFGLRVGLPAPADEPATEAAAAPR